MAIIITIIIITIIIIVIIIIVINVFYVGNHKTFSIKYLYYNSNINKRYTN